jgi:D-alanyl-D-alanine carboxypeptidase
MDTAQDAYSPEHLQQWNAVKPAERWLRRIRDGCVLLGMAGKHVVATNGLDLDEGEMVGLFVRPDFQRLGLGRRLVESIEKLAIQFGMTQLKVEAARPSIEFFRACRYTARDGVALNTDPRTGLDCLSMERHFPHRQTRYSARITRLLKQCGIPHDYGRRHRLRLQPEARELATVGKDVFEREQFLQPEAAMAWYGLRNAAGDDGITLQMASGFRSVGYQVSIIQRKRLAGQSLEQILSVSAAPGYSEHHTGRAIDLTSPDSKPLETEFENTLAFEWLTEHAESLGFSLSYPRNNRHRIAYEPWHWKFCG